MLSLWINLQTWNTILGKVTMQASEGIRLGEFLAAEGG